MPKVKYSLKIFLSIWGVCFLALTKPSFFHHSQKKGIWMIFFVGSIIGSLGSMFYHWNPSNFSLAVDRFLLSIIFMTFFSLMIMERINCRADLLLFPWLLLGGVSIVLYWIFTENLSRGDLRPYILTQFFPLIAIALILLLFSPSYSGQR